MCIKAIVTVVGLWVGIIALPFLAQFIASKIDSYLFDADTIIGKYFQGWAILIVIIALIFLFSVCVTGSIKLYYYMCK